MVTDHGDNRGWIGGTSKNGGQRASGKGEGAGPVSAAAGKGHRPAARHRRPLGVHDVQR